jgi:excisionase family DNA binding protein
MNDTLSILTKAEAAARLKIPERSIDRLRAEGKLPTLILGQRRVRFHAADVEALLVPRRA